MTYSISHKAFAWAAAVTLLTACSQQSSPPFDATTSKAATQSAGVPQKSDLKVSYTSPEDWMKSETKGTTIYTAPEGDAVLAIISVGKADDAETAATAAWSQYDVDFSRDLRLNTAQPAKRGWDEMHAIEYETSPEENHLAYAYTHVSNGEWKVLLLDGNLATIVKRQAAARGMLDSFKIKGYTKEDLSSRTALALTPERIKMLTDFVTESAKALDVPGVGFALIQNGEVVYEGGVGVKAFGSSDPVDENTRFMIASNTKGMTTLLLAKLVDMGKLDWDDQVIKHYPTFKLGDQKTTESVLIKHLVCACTGLPRKDMDLIFNSGPETPASAVFSDLAATAPTSDFGDLFQYNNQMAAAAGYVAGHIFYPDMEIGAAYDKAMQTYIFDPLKMDDTTFSIPEAIKGNYAKPHATDVNDKVQIIEQTATRGFNYVFYPYRPAGSAWSSPHDMMKYIRNELSEGVAPDGTRLFAAAPLLKRRESTVPTGEDSFYGMGLSTEKIAGIEIVNHGGRLAGYLSQMVIIPSANTGAVILTNSDSGGAMLDPFTRRLVEILYDGKSEAKEQIAASAEAAQSNREKFRADFVIPPKAELVAGLAKHYHSDELGPLNLKKVGGKNVLDPDVWSTTFGTKDNPDGTISLVMTNPFLLGLEVVVDETDGKRTLTLIDTQHKYVFTEVEK